jgi:hypothetical protein
MKEYKNILKKYSIRMLKYWIVIKEYSTGILKYYFGMVNLIFDTLEYSGEVAP